MSTLRLRQTPEAPKGPEPVCVIKVEGPPKGHPPVTINVFGRTPKDGVNALKKLLFTGKYKVVSNGD